MMGSPAQPARTTRSRSAAAPARRALMRALVAATTATALASASAAVSGAAASPDANVSGAAASSSYLSLSGGDGFTCVVRKDKTVACAGFNSYGTLGNGQLTNTPSAVLVQNGNFKAQQISCGYNHVCAVGTDSKAYCWGGTSSGAVGVDPSPYGYDGQTTTPVAVVSSSGLGPVSKVCASMYYTVAIQAKDNSLWGWGSNMYGVLGTRTNAGPTDNYKPMIFTASDGSLAGGVKDVSCGATHVCYISATTGFLGCNGFNNQGQIAGGGLGVFIEPVWATGVVVKSVAAGQWHTCGAGVDGSLWCAGGASSYQAGFTTQQNALTKVPGFTNNVVSVVAGVSYTVAVLADGSARFFGSNDQGQAGVGSSSPRLLPVSFAGGAKVQTVAAGTFHTCFVPLAGTSIMCEGLNRLGALGVGSFSSTQVSPMTSTLGSASSSGGGGSPTTAPPTTAPPTAPPTSSRKKKNGRGGRRQRRLRGSAHSARAGARVLGQEEGGVVVAADDDADADGGDDEDADEAAGDLPGLVIGAR